MVKKIIHTLVWSALGLLLLAFETTIGLPILSLLFSLRFLFNLEGKNRLIATFLISLAVALSLHVSLTMVFICLTLATIISIKIKQDMVLQHAAIASVCVLIIVVLGQIQLFPLSFIYFFIVWLAIMCGTIVHHVKTNSGQMTSR